MPAALSRFANPAARIGHAGHQAPTLDDERALFLADLPALPLSAEVERLRRVNAHLEAVLGRVFEETRDYPDEKPFSSDSYLPPCMVSEIAEALHYARQA